MHYIGSIAFTDSKISEHILPLHIIDLNCTGDENNIWQCPMNSLTQHQCWHYNDAVVGCQIGTL